MDWITETIRKADDRATEQAQAAQEYRNRAMTATDPDEEDRLHLWADEAEERAKDARNEAEYYRPHAA